MQPSVPCVFRRGEAYVLSTKETISPIDIQPRHPFQHCVAPTSQSSVPAAQSGCCSPLSRNEEAFSDPHRFCEKDKEPLLLSILAKVPAGIPGEAVVESKLEEHRDEGDKTHGGWNTLFQGKSSQRPALTRSPHGFPFGGATGRLFFVRHGEVSYHAPQWRLARDPARFSQKAISAV